MAQKHLLHELLKEDQEPFQLKSFIADRCSQLKKPGPNPTKVLQLKKPRPAKLSKHACFFSFQNSPDVRKSPFPDFQSPAMSPCKSPNGAVFLNIPSKTAALLVEAAARIQKQQQSNSKSTAQIKNVSFGFFGSFLKRLKDRSKTKKRAIGDSAVTVTRKKGKKREEETEQQNAGMTCSNNSRRMSGGDWTEISGVKSVDFEASTSGSSSDDFASRETRFCSSPFRFSLNRSRSSSSGRRTPDFSSPAASPRSHEKESYDTRDSEKIRGEDEEKEQCSPVSVLEPPFEDDGHESEDAEEEDYDLDCSYANVQRAKQQLLYRLRRFEKLAELDPIELERKLLEESDEDDDERAQSNEDFVQFSPHKKHSEDICITEVFNQPTFRNHSKKMPNDMKRLVSDLIVEEKGEMACSSNNEVVFGRICNRLDLWKEMEFDTIDMMIELDFKKDFDGWKKFSEQVEESAEEIEFAIYGLLMEELLEELCYVDGYDQEDENSGIECT